MIVTIHQPEHLPWLGFFDKIRQADVFVMLDHVQYRKHYFQNRNKVRAHNGAIWLTVPVLTKDHLSQAIKDVRVDDHGGPRWREKCWASIVQNYRKAIFWRDHETFFGNLYQKDWKCLVDLNETIIQYILNALSIRVKVMKSSTMNVEGSRGDLLLNICREVGADVYLSGVSGRDYLDLNVFTQANIEVRFQEFYHPIYTQIYEPFLPCMSTIDLLFNYGPASLEVIKGVGVEKMDHVFE